VDGRTLARPMVAGRRADAPDAALRLACSAATSPGPGARSTSLRWAGPGRPIPSER